MQSVALVIHVLLAIGVIGLVLIQHGKGAEAGAAFGSGASATVFGARGSGSFLTRMTTLLAALFFLTSLGLFYIAAHRDGGTTRSVTDIDVPTVQESAPADSDVPSSGAGDDAAATADEALPEAAADESASGQESDAESGEVIPAPAE